MCFLAGNHRVSSKSSLFQLGLAYNTSAFVASLSFRPTKNRQERGKFAFLGHVKAKKLSASGERALPRLLPLSPVGSKAPRSPLWAPMFDLPGGIGEVNPTG